MADIFISYARADHEKIEKLAAALEAEGYSVWWDRNIVAGSEFSADIEQELDAASVVVVCWSAAAKKSAWVKDEAAVARDQEKLIPLRLDGQPAPMGFRQLHAVDFSQWAGDRVDAAFQDLSRAVEAKTATAESLTPPALGRSIAVLPFANMSSDPEQEYFSDGVAEEIINTLMKIDGLRVSGRTSSFSFKGSNAPLSEIGEALNVKHILEGSVRKQGARVRIAAQLLNAADGFHEWSQTFDRDLDDIFEVQDEIARAIADALSVHLQKTSSLLVARATDNEEAYEAFLQGRYIIRQRYGPNGGDAIKRSIAFFELALERDPNFARAWSSLSMAYTWTPQYVEDANRNAAFAKSIECAARATELDPTIGEHHAGLAVLRMYTREYELGLASARRAVALDPGNATVQRMVGNSSLLYGYIDKAGPHIEEAIRIDPTSGMEIAWAAQYHFLTKNFEAAERFARRSLDLGCKFGLHVLAELDFRNGRYDDAGEKFYASMHSVPSQHESIVKRIVMSTLAGPDVAAEANKLMDDYLALSDRAPSEMIVMMLIKLGRFDQAVDVFHEGMTNHEDAILLEVWNPSNDAFRRSEAFKRFVRETDLLSLWRNSGWPKLVRPVGDNDFEYV